MQMWSFAAESELLECPGCGGSFPEARAAAGRLFDAGYYGVLKCQCSEYPVLAGIPVIMKGRLPYSGASVRQLLQLLRQGRCEQALLTALTPDVLAEAPDGYALPMPQFARQRLRVTRRRDGRQRWIARFRVLDGDTSPGSVIRLIRHYFGARADAGNYFAFRAGQPKYLVSCALASLTAEPHRRCLDLGCGAGQITRILCGAPSGHAAVGIDNNFFLLWLANTRVSPGSAFICADVERGLPLRSRSFDLLLLSNVYHFLFQKRYMLMEAKRVGSTHATVVISSLRNANVPAATPNAALDPGGYRHLYQDLYDKSVMISQRQLLAHLVGWESSRLEAAADDALADAALLNVVLGEGAGVLGRDLRGWIDRARPVRVNPLYRCRPGNADGLRLERRWPSAGYIADNPEMPLYLPEGLELPAPITSALAEARFDAGMEPYVRTGVLVDLPRSY